MGNANYSYYNQIQPLTPQQANKFGKDISCIIQPKNNRGGLFLGNATAASNLQLLKYCGIASVLTVAIEADVHYNGVIPYHLVIQAYDNNNYDLRQNIKQSMKFIKLSLQKTNVLIHCMMGISRSTSFVLWYLMTEKKLSLSQAYALVKSRRPIINPNKGFITQLTNLQNYLKQQVPPQYQQYQYQQPKNNVDARKLIQNVNNDHQLRYSGVQI